MSESTGVPGAPETGVSVESPPPAQMPPVPPATPPGSPGPSAGRPRGRAVVTWGVVLIVVGGLLLVNQFVPGFGVWRFWPLIIVALGVRQMFRRTERGWDVKEAAEGLVTVAFGLLFLGQMLGVIGWGVWLELLRLWPLLLVAIGIDLIGKGLRQTWLRVASSLVIVAGIAYGAFVMTPSAGWPPLLWWDGDVESFSFSEEHDADVEEGAVRIDGGVGTLDIRAGDELVTAEGRSPFDPEFSVEVSGRSADVSVGPGSGVWVPSGDDAGLEVTLDADVVWDVSVDAGVSSFTADLRDLKVSALDLGAGVSRGVVTLGPADAAGGRDAVKVGIDVGVSALTMRVPEGEPVRVSVNEGLTSVSVRGEWDRDDQDGDRTWESDGFDDNGAYWDIVLRAGIGSVTVEYY